MQTLTQQLEQIIAAGRKKQIRIQGRQLMITPDVARRIVCVLDELSEPNQAWFLQQEARAMLQLADRLFDMILQRKTDQGMRMVFASTLASTRITKGETS